MKNRIKNFLRTYWREIILALLLLNIRSIAIDAREKSEYAYDYAADAADYAADAASYASDASDYASEAADNSSWCIYN